MHWPIYLYIFLIITTVEMKTQLIDLFIRAKKHHWEQLWLNLHFSARTSEEIYRVRWSLILQSGQTAVATLRRKWRTNLGSYCNMLVCTKTVGHLLILAHSEGSTACFRVCGKFKIPLQPKQWHTFYSAAVPPPCLWCYWWHHCAPWKTKVKK